jgi:excisionase family DNA binding protein
MQAMKEVKMDSTWNTEECANYFGKSPQWIRENIENLGIPAHKLGNQWRFIPEEVILWISNQ